MTRGSGKLGQSEGTETGSGASAETGTQTGAEIGAGIGADAPGTNDDQNALSPEVQALAETWPRALIADGWSEGLAEWWILSRARSVAMGAPPFAATGFSPAIGQALFESRRARRLVRGLEGAEASLVTQEIGLSQTPAAQTQLGKPRVSRLLVVSQDGSPRFYHQVEKLQAQFAQRLQVLRIECDEATLGYAIFGGGQRARAVLLDHKEAVLLLLGALIAEMSENESAEAPDAEPSSGPSASAVPPVPPDPAESV